MSLHTRSRVWSGSGPVATLSIGFRDHGVRPLNPMEDRSASVIFLQKAWTTQFFSEVRFVDPHLEVYHLDRSLITESFLSFPFVLNGSFVSFRLRCVSLLV